MSCEALSERSAGCSPTQKGIVARGHGKADSGHANLAVETEACVDSIDKRSLWRRPPSPDCGLGHVTGTDGAVRTPSTSGSALHPSSTSAKIGGQWCL